MSRFNKLPEHLRKIFFPPDWVREDDEDSNLSSMIECPEPPPQVNPRAADGRYLCLKCGSRLRINVTAHYTGEAFDPTGYCVDDLDVVGDAAVVTCDSCGAHEAFETFQERNDAREDEKPAVVWHKALRPVGDPTPHARLLGTVEIAGVLHHVEAVEVREQDGVQCAADPAMEEALTNVSRIVGGRMASVKIDGRDYVLCVTPFQD